MPTNVRFEDIEWKNAPRGYYLTDVKQKTLWVNEETGATLALIKFPPGIADKLHTHPNANQIVYGITGEIRTPKGIMIPDGKNVNITPKGEVHGHGDFVKESIALFYWDGPPKPDEVE
jgi:quercetin dioxygenase-like cupin family protein